jgi:Ring finger domain
MSVEPVEFVIDRNPSPISVILENDTESIFISPPLGNVNTNRRCSFCECPGHTIRNCNHADIQNLHRSAQFIFLTTTRYLRLLPNGQKTHHKWLSNLSTSEYKILARLNQLNSNSRTTREAYEEMLKVFYTNYAMNELRNDRSTNATPIHNIYIHTLTQYARRDFMVRYGERLLDDVIIKSGRYLLDMHKIRQMFREGVIYYSLTDRQEFIRYYQGGYLTDNNNFDNFVINLSDHFGESNQPVTKILPTLNDNVELETEVHEECPICYSEMTKETAVQLGCNHSFCGDCIVRQIKSSRKSTTECGLCRSTIKECRSTSRNLLEHMSSNFAN